MTDDGHARRTHQMHEDAALASTLLSFGFGLSVGSMVTLLTMGVAFIVGVDVLFIGSALVGAATVILAVVYLRYRNPRPLFELIEEVGGDA